MLIVCDTSLLQFALPRCWRRGYSNRQSHPTKSLVSRRNKEVCLRASRRQEAQTGPAVRIPSPPATRQCEPLVAKLQALVPGHHCEPSILHMSSSILLRTSSTGFEEGDDDDEAFAASWSAFSLAACSSFSLAACAASRARLSSAARSSAAWRSAAVSASSCGRSSRQT